MIPRIADMGFDVIYFPPIHPIGETNRKGRNNSPVSGASDPGSPWHKYVNKKDWEMNQEK